VVGGTVFSMAIEEILKHPFIALMMQQLEALEGKKSDAEVGNYGKVTKEFPTPRERVEDTRREVHDG